MSEREHGYARYKLDGCRCPTCEWAVAQYNDAREHAIRRGTTIDTMGAATPVDATGARRRLQALVVGGWPQRVLAAELGMTPGNFGAFLSHRERVLVRHVRAVREVYDRLWKVDPLEYGASAGGVTRARRYAAERGWAPVGAWDDDTIDDPAAHPDWTGRCGTAEGYDAHRRAGLLPACGPCRAALNERQREQKRRRREARGGAVMSR